MEGQIFFNEVKASFNLREPKANKPTNIYLVCRIDKKQVKLSTEVRIYPDQWDTKRQEAYVSPRLTELDNMNNLVVNNKISELKSNFLEFKRYICDNPSEISNSLFILKKYIYKDRIMKHEETQRPIQWLRQAIANDNRIKAKTDKKVDTFTIYQGHLSSFEKFLIETGNENITFNDINLALITDYEKYLFAKRIGGGKIPKTSTVANKVTALIGILKRAEAYDLIDMHASKIDKYKMPKSREGDDNEIYLTEEEINRIYMLQLNGIRETVRDLFVLQCWTGQRFGDMATLLNAGVLKKVDTGEVLEIAQEKKLHKVVIPLLPVAQEILKKYDYKIPNINNTRIYQYLKEIGEKARIIDEHIVIEDRGGKITNAKYEKYKLIGTHTARRSFISNMLKRGYDSHIIRKITGHLTEESFKKYARLTPEDAALLMLETEASKETKNEQSKEVVGKSKKKVKVLDYLFAETSLLRLDELQANGINIYDLAETTKTIAIIKDIKQTDKVKEFLASIDKSILFGRVDKLDSIIWNIARYYFDFTLYQVFQQKVIELGLSENITDVIDADDLNELWHQEYVLKELEKEQPD